MIASRMTGDCPAKINLGLRIIGKRNDGFHELQTVMVPVSLCDRLQVTTRNDQDLRMTILVAVDRWSSRAELGQTGEIPTDDRNLVIRVARAFQKAAKVSLGADFALIKRIPAGGGLGGASSNAATALRLLNRVWGVGWSQEQLAGFSASFGSDIPFFFAGGAALCEGRGERICPLSVSYGRWAVLTRPEVAIATPDVFSRLDAGPLKPNQQSPPTDPWLRALSASLCPEPGSGSQRPGILDHALANDLWAPALEHCPRLGRVAQTICDTHPLGSTMSGSGSCFVAFYRNRRQAAHAAKRLRNQKIGRTIVVRPSRTMIDSHQLDMLLSRTDH